MTWYSPFEGSDFDLRAGIYGVWRFVRFVREIGSRFFAAEELRRNSGRLGGRAIPVE